MSEVNCALSLGDRIFHARIETQKRWDKSVQLIIESCQLIRQARQVLKSTDPQWYDDGWAEPCPAD